MAFQKIIEIDEFAKTKLYVTNCTRMDYSHKIYHSYCWQRFRVASMNNLLYFCMSQQQKWHMRKMNLKLVPYMGAKSQENVVFSP